MKRLIFIPGIMGTELNEGNDTKRWHSPRNKNLRRLRYDSNEPNTINPGKALRRAYNFIGNLVSENVVYGKFISFLDSLDDNVNITSDEFGYDWRLDLRENCPLLHELLSGYQKTDEIILIGHSMGGLLAHTYCQWADEHSVLPNITKVITLATPWHGSPEAYLALMYGLEKRCFPDPEVIAEISKTFPSIYQLLPSQNILMTHDFLFRDNNRSSWKEIFDFLKEQRGCNISNPGILNSEIHNSLANAWPGNIKHYHIIGHDHGTFSKFRISYKFEDYADINDGDETVPVDYSVPPPEYNAETFYVRSTHQGIVKLRHVNEWVKRIVLDQDYSSVPNISAQYTVRNDWDAQRIACPVEVLIEDEINIFDDPIHPYSTNRIGNVTYVIYNSKENIEISVEPYDVGLTSMETISIRGEEEITIEKFPSIEVNPANKAVVSVSFDDFGKPKTKVYARDEAGKSQQLTGIEVPHRQNTYFDPPTTKAFLKPVGQRAESKYFSHEGVIVNFTVNAGHKDTKTLETIYSVNNGPEQRYKDEKFFLSIKNGLVYGKNIITYYSKDIYNNIERSKSREFYLEPPHPIVYTQVIVTPDAELTINTFPLIEGVRDYEYKFKLNEEDSEKELDEEFELRFSEAKSFHIQATDRYNNTSSWNIHNLDLTELAEYLWDPDNNDYLIEDVAKKLPQSIDTIKSIVIGSSEKKLTDKIPKNAKNLLIIFEDIEYDIALNPYYDVFLLYHSEVINRKDDEVKISFIVLDSEGKKQNDLFPHVKYSFLPVKDADQDVQIAKVTNDGKGVYSFTIMVKYLSTEVNKIRFDFRDSHKRANALKIKEFKLQ